MTNTGFSRRSTAKGAAWAVPAVAVAASAPAVAASPIPAVKGASSYFDKYRDDSPKTIDCRIDTQGGCSYTVTNGPATVSNLVMTYWLPVANYAFSPPGSTVWSTPTRDTTKSTMKGANAGGSYYY